MLPRRAPQRRRDLALALIVARLLEPAAKLATARMLDPATASHSLGEMLGLGAVAAKEVYAALDWLGREQPFIEAQLARRHLKEGALLLSDVTSTYLEGRCCELAQHGYSRDHRGDRPQLVIGLMCAAEDLVQPVSACEQRASRARARVGVAKVRKVIEYIIIGASLTDDGRYSESLQYYEKAMDVSPSTLSLRTCFPNSDLGRDSCRVKDLPTARFPGACSVNGFNKTSL